MLLYNPERPGMFEEISSIYLSNEALGFFRRFREVDFFYGDMKIGSYNCFRNNKILCQSLYRNGIFKIIEPYSNALVGHLVITESLGCSVVPLYRSSNFVVDNSLFI